MQKPDADGFITVNWPSKSIPHGGIFHSHVAQSNTNHQEFLKVLLEESKLSITQRKKSSYYLRDYETRNSDFQPKRQMPLVRPRTSKRRSLSAIRESGAFEFEPILPQKRGEDREKLKQKLANIMAYGDTPEQTPPLPPRVGKTEPKLPSSKEMWHDLVTQIRERAEWLAEMENLGQAGPHRDIIKDQIAERMRALDLLGIDSECSTARSNISGFSTLRSTEAVQISDRPTVNRQSEDLIQSSKSNKSKAKRSTGKRQAVKEENISAYNQITPLQYSPRRRV